MPGKQGLDFLDIGWNIHGLEDAVHTMKPDLMTVVKGSELLEALAPFVGAGRQVHIPEKKMLPEQVDADVEKELGVFRESVDLSRKGQCTVSRDMDLYAIGIGQNPRFFNGCAECAHFVMRCFEKPGDGGIESCRIDERFIPLHIDDGVAVELFGDLGDTVCSAPVRGRGENSLPAERCHRGADFLGIGGDDNPLSSSDLGTPLIHPLDHGLLPYERQGFPGESRGGISGGDERPEQFYDRVSG